MLLLYNTGIRLYYFVIRIASLFNLKARLWVNGRKDFAFIRNTESIWFHFASLGEFEQGRPVLEKMRGLYPQCKIVITFFSPSGYEVRKNTPLADAVYYLPLDTAKNAANFIATINPRMAIFTKYEYWYHFFNEMHKRGVPLYVISGIFRPGQIFFKSYGGLHREMLGFVSHFFVQDDNSKQLLKSLNIINVTVSGDTRFDRVWGNAQHPMKLPFIDEFKNEHKLFIAGSTWPEDEQLIATLVNTISGWKFIIAPHEIDEDKIENLLTILKSEKVARFSHISQLTTNNQQPETQTPQLKILIIDNVGMLSSLYQYGDIAYIGGGFGAGIHNTLEAAAFGLPVIFGPEYSKFNEAKDLIAIKAGFNINGEADLKGITDTLIDDEIFYWNAANGAKAYVAGHIGATATIVKFIMNGH